MQDLINEIQIKQKQLEASVKQLRITGAEYAEAEKNYKILLRQEILKLRDQKVAIGVIELTCYGIPSVAEARFKRDIAEMVYKANQEAIQMIKLEMRILDGQIQREWGGGGE